MQPCAWSWLCCDDPWAQQNYYQVRACLSLSTTISKKLHANKLRSRLLLKKLIARDDTALVMTPLLCCSCYTYLLLEHMHHIREADNALPVQNDVSTLEECGPPPQREYVLFCMNISGEGLITCQHFQQCGLLSYKGPNNHYRPLALGHNHIDQSWPKNRFPVSCSSLFFIDSMLQT